MFESGGTALRCVVTPGGTGQTELQVHAIADLEADECMGAFEE